MHPDFLFYGIVSIIAYKYRPLSNPGNKRKFVVQLDSGFLYFGRLHDRRSFLQPIVVVQLLNPFNAFPGSNHRWNISNRGVVENPIYGGCPNLCKVLGYARELGES